MWNVVMIESMSAHREIHAPLSRSGDHICASGRGATYWTIAAFPAPLPPLVRRPDEIGIDNGITRVNADSRDRPQMAISLDACAGRLQTGIEHLCSDRRTTVIDFKNGSIFKLKPDSSYQQIVGDLLVSGESVIGSYKAIRDGVVFTNKRVIAVNVQGITGKKKDFTSLPYSKIVAFSVETAGTFDLDAELELWFSGLGNVKFDFTGSTDVAELARLVGEYVL